MGADNTSLNYTLSLKDLFSKKMDGMLNQTKRLDSGMNKLNSTVGKLGGAIAGYFAVSNIVRFGGAIIESLKNFEYFTAAIKTMLGGDAQAAKALQGQLVELAKTTPFSLNDVQQASKQLLAYGFKAGDLVKTMRTLGDVSAGVGAPLGDIAYLYGTLKTSGRVMQVDLRQFAGRGIPIYEELAKVLKVNVKQVNQLVHDGKVGFRDVEKAFKNMTSEGGHFFNLMNDQSKTVGGRISNLGDVWEQLKVNIGRSQTGIINGTVTWVSNMVSAMNDAVAATNRMDDAFAKASINGLTKAEHWLQTISTGMNDMSKKAFLGKDMFQVNQNDKFIQEEFVQPSNKGKLEAVQAKAGILNFMTSLSKDFVNKNINKNQYDKTYALAKEGLSSVLGNIKLFDTKENPNKPDDGGPDKMPGAGTEVSGNRPQNLYITINDGLVKQMNIYATTITESVAKVKEAVSVVLLEAVNDVNQSGGPPQ